MSETPQYLTRPDGTRLAVYQHEPHAQPDVTLVLAHGWSSAARVWDPVITQLPVDGRLRVITYDQRGHGSSTHGRTPPDIDVLADDLEAVLTAFSHDVPAIVAGHSMGSMAVLAYAARGAPTTRVAGLLLVSASSGQVDLRLDDHPPLTRVRGNVRMAIAQACSRAPRSTQHLRDLLSPSTAPRPDIDVAAAWFRAILDFDVAGRLTPLQNTPVHLVTGAQDRVLPPLHTCRLAAELVHARIHVAEGATHRLPSERPALLASLLMNLVDRARGRRPAETQETDSLLRAVAHLLLPKRRALPLAGRFARIEPHPVQRPGTPTHLGQETLIETRQ
ncbi:alpha/beta fold hydrolase [Streptomyces sp. NPDC058256]|uniref:alpha/beta fold hydrolase n=1 Tax=Streptomyces sp. NPDC058256 TaxID=3346408 RepID=UPI0036E435EB